MAKRIAVVLSGCGRVDGSEITEAVSALLSLSELNVDYELFSPKVALEESNRIGRGEVKDLRDLQSSQFDGIVFPGGMGAAKLLSNFAEKGTQAHVAEGVALLISQFYEQGKPILAICIAPNLVALTLGKKGITITVGAPGETADELKKTGAILETCAVDDFVTDREHKIITTPAYMYGEAQPFEVYTGIRKAIRELIEMA